jgi:hypothetical protein
MRNLKPEAKINGVKSRSKQQSSDRLESTASEPASLPQEAVVQSLRSWGSVGSLGGASPEPVGIVCPSRCQPFRDTWAETLLSHWDATRDPQQPDATLRQWTLGWLCLPRDNGVYLKWAMLPILLGGGWGAFEIGIKFRHSKCLFQSTWVCGSFRALGMPETTLSNFHQTDHLIITTDYYLTVLDKKFRNIK